MTVVLSSTCYSLVYPTIATLHSKIDAESALDRIRDGAARIADL